MAHYEGADSFLLQETQQGIQEFGDVSREGGLRGMLRNEVLMKNLGMLFAADAIIGNGTGCASRTQATSFSRWMVR